MKPHLVAASHDTHESPLTYMLVMSPCHSCLKRKSIKLLAHPCAHVFPQSAEYSHVFSHSGQSLTCYDSVPVFTSVFAPLLVPDSVTNRHTHSVKHKHTRARSWAQGAFPADASLTFTGGSTTKTHAGCLLTSHHNSAKTTEQNICLH